MVLMIEMDPFYILLPSCQHYITFVLDIYKHFILKQRMSRFKGDPDVYQWIYSNSDVKALKDSLFPAENPAFNLIVHFHLWVSKFSYLANI